MKTGFVYCSRKNKFLCFDYSLSECVQVWLRSQSFLLEGFFVSGEGCMRGSGGMNGGKEGLGGLNCSSNRGFVISTVALFCQATFRITLNQAKGADSTGALTF